MSTYIKESDIKDKINELEKLKLDLDQYVATFTNHVNEIQDLLVGLKVCLNTTGGVRRLKDLADIEFDTVSINNATSKISEITVTYKTHRENLNRIPLLMPHK